MGSPDGLHGADIPPEHANARQQNNAAHGCPDLRVSFQGHDQVQCRRCRDEHHNQDVHSHLARGSRWAIHAADGSTGPAISVGVPNAPTRQCCEAIPSPTTILYRAVLERC